MTTTITVKEIHAYILAIEATRMQQQQEGEVEAEEKEEEEVGSRESEWGNKDSNTIICNRSRRIPGL